MTHIETIDRFKNTDYLASYVGLIPNSHSSGESENKGEMTFRGQNHLKAILVESSWVAVRVDPALSLSYNTYIHRMQPNKAIIRIARKLLNRIYYVLKNQREYVCGVVN
jgi:transposase